MRWILPLLLLLCWFFFANSWVSKKKSTCCALEASTSTAAAAVAATKKKAIVDETGNLLFAWSDCKPKKATSWPNFRDSLIKAIPKDYLLEIKTWKYKSESNTCDEKDLAESRSNQIQALFNPHIDKDKVRYSSMMRTDKTEEWKSNLFRAASFKYARDGKFVKEIDNRALIYHPTAQAKKLNNKEIDNYLKDVAARIKKSGEKVVLTGHTDNTGSTESNRRLGQRRADYIKSILVQMGAPANQISTSSKGETTPIATNDTSDGRQKNRRTELIIQ